MAFLGRRKERRKTGRRAAGLTVSAALLTTLLTTVVAVPAWPAPAGATPAATSGTEHGARTVPPAQSPGAVLALADMRSLQSKLARATSSAALGPTAAKKSCAEVVQGGRVLFEDHPDLPVVPASNMKLLTAKALLAELGPERRFYTAVLAGSRPADGVVDGNLYLRGGGDPLLRLSSYAKGFAPGGGVYTDFAALPRLLKAAGVREVTGSVVGDASRYDSLNTVPGWPIRYQLQGDVGPLSALGLDDGFAEAGAPVPEGAPPPVQAAGVLTDLLRKAGIEVAGLPREGKAPAQDKVIATLVSPPLESELGEILRESDNTAMELLTKELGRVQYGTGSTAAGTKAVRADLAAEGLPLQGFVNVDGSGLSYHDRVTCSLLVAVLERSGPGGLLVRDLPVAARSGTLAHQMQGTPAAGRVYAKTGNLDGVVALSGWAYPAGAGAQDDPALHRPVVFAVVLNGLSLAVADPFALTFKVAEDIVAFPPAPAFPPAAAVPPVKVVTAAHY
jgi:D-alanyl-D-alanine carboxypeptidase/D-alanyl-D-alanine-endopeptidase (penicillin-binding protein 4)